MRSTTIAQGTATPRAQPADGVTYAAKIRKEEAAIDWSRSAAEIDRQVRAFDPWPVAETRWNGQQLRVWEAMPIDSTASAERPAKYSAPVPQASTSAQAMACCG